MGKVDSHFLMKRDTKGVAVPPIKWCFVHCDYLFFLCMHSRARKHTLTRKLTNIHMHTYIRTQAHVHAYMHVHMHTSSCVYILFSC